MLLVEDREEDALLTLRELERGGYEVHSERVETAEGLLGALSDHDWDLILSDHHLPSLDSLQALRLAREAGSHAPFVVVSGGIGEEAAVEAIRTGVQDYVMKGDLSRLRAVVVRAMNETEGRRRTERELARRDATLRAVRFAANRMLGEAEDWEGSIRAVLRRLGEAVGMSRVYVYENYLREDGELRATHRYEWVAPGVSPQINNPAQKDFRYVASGAGRWVEKLGRGETVSGNTRDFPAIERPALEEQDILSIAVVPIFVRGNWWGVIGFDDCASEHEWSTAEVAALGAAAGTLGAAIRRKHTEEELRASEAELRAVFGAMDDVILVLDGDGRYLKAAPTIHSWLYRPPEELVGKTVYDTFPREQADLILASIRRTLETRERVNIEYGLNVGDVEMWFTATITPMTKKLVVAVARDITERRQNEVALRQSEELYRAVIEQTTENILLVDLETCAIVESNPAFREALGYTEDELQDMTLYDVVVAGQDSVDAEVRRVSEQHLPLVGEREYRRKDGSSLNVDVSASVISRGGRETLCVVAHDVTERARMQGLLEERVATLSRIAASLALDSPMGSTLDLLAKSVVRASPAIACLVALNDEGTGEIRLVGSHGVPEEYKAGMQTSYNSDGGDPASPSRVAVRTRQPVIFRNARQAILDNPLRAPLHRLVQEASWDTVYIVPLLSRGTALGTIHFGYPQGQEPPEDEKVFLGAVADQAAVVVENARLFSEARGKAALEERQRLARELHDSVSQALYGIALGTETAREDLAENPAEVPELLDYVHSLAEAGMAEMRALIFELRPESLETEGLIAALQKQADALRARHGIVVEVEHCDEPGAPVSVKEALYRIVQEALHNTVKHARAQKVGLVIGCTQAQVTVEVTDDGIGFDPKGDFPGHLGLRSMRERVQSLGGTLEVRSGRVSGTSVRASIPL